MFATEFVIVSSIYYRLWLDKTNTNYSIHSSCVDAIDDIYTPCFGCDTDSSSRNRDIYQTSFNHNGKAHPNRHHDYPFWIKRQTGESFSATTQSQRVIRSNNGGARLRVDRKMEVRNRSYGETQRFVQNEEYLSDEDLDILRRFHYL